MLLVAIFTFLYPVSGVLIIPLLILMNYHQKCAQDFKWLFLAIVFIIASLGYSMGEWGDLERYHQQLMVMETVDFSTIIQFDFEYLYVADALLYFVSQTENMQILNYLIGFIVYGLVFYVLFDLLKRSSIDFSIGTIIKMIVIIIGIVPFFNIIANVRCITAYIIILFAAYRDLIQDKKNILTYLLYVIPIGLHVSAIIVLLLRFIQIIAKKLGRGIIVIAVFIPLLIDFLYQYSGMLEGNLIGSLLSNAIGKAYTYLYWTDGGFATEIQDNLTNKLTRIYGVFFIGTIVFSLLIAKSKSIQVLHHDIFEEPMIAYLYVLSACTLGCLYIVTGAFWRFEAAIVLFSPVVLIPLLELKDRGVNICLNLLFLSGIFMLFMNFIYMYRNMDVASMAKTFALTTGIEIIYYILNGILNILV